jgi:predicted N-acetyltransferase YhbS
LTLTRERLERWSVRVAEAQDGELLGVVAFSMEVMIEDMEDGPVQAELELLFVEPEWMGAGVGAALMRDITARLAERGVETLWILSDPGAEAFYVRLGARRAGLRPSDAIPGRKLPWLRLELARSHG